MSPTICSIMSSTETMPLNPPYSSMSMARCCFSFCSSLNSASIFFVSGTKYAGLSSFLISTLSMPFTLALYRKSLMWSMPTMLSGSFLYTGILECVSSDISSMYSFLSASRSIMNTSVLGVMISYARRSSNSKIESIILRPSSLISPDSWPLSSMDMTLSSEKYASSTSVSFPIILRMIFAIPLHTHTSGSVAQ